MPSRQFPRVPNADDGASILHGLHLGPTGTVFPTSPIWRRWFQRSPPFPFGDDGNAVSHHSQMGILFKAPKLPVLSAFAVSSRPVSSWPRRRGSAQDRYFPQVPNGDAGEDVPHEPQVRTMGIAFPTSPKWGFLLKPPASRFFACLPLSRRSRPRKSSLFVRLSRPALPSRYLRKLDGFAPVSSQERLLRCRSLGWRHCGISSLALPQGWQGVEPKGLLAPNAHAEQL